MKKVIAMLLLALVLGSTAVFANGTSESSTKEVKKTDMLLWLPPFASGDSLDEQFWSEALQPWADENNVNLSIEITPWGGYEEKYLTGFASGDGPDVGYMYMQMFYDYIQMGALEDLDKYFTQEEKDNYYYWAQGNMMGGQYCLPFVVGNARIMYVNQDILDQAGVTQLPETWDEFIDACVQIKENVPGVMPFAQSWADPSIGLLDDNFFPYFWQAGGQIYNDEGTKLALTDTDAAYKAANFLHDLRFKYDIIDEAQLGITNVTDDFKQGNVAFACLGANKAKSFTDAGLNWTFIPSLKETTKGIWVASDSLIMNSASEHKDLAASLIKEITSAPIMTRFHTEISPFTPITKTEEYNDYPAFKDMYENDTPYFHTLPVAKASATIFDNLCKNLQLMMMGEISPEQAIDRTVEYSTNVL
ncbi:MAG: ABC transporter substrate-binding protein [Pleomorphochaeta sp.]